MHNHEENDNIGRNIRFYRIRAGLTVKELSRCIREMQGAEIKTGSIRHYEKGVEKIPAIALHYIAMATKTEIYAFYKPAQPAVLLNSQHKVHLLEAFSMVHCQACQDALIDLTRKLGKRQR